MRIEIKSAPASAAFNLLVELFQGDAKGIWFEVCIPQACLGNTFVYIVKDGQQRLEHMAREHGPFPLRQVQSEFSTSVMLTITGL